MCSEGFNLKANKMHRAVYFFCNDQSIDPVAYNVFSSIEKLFALEEVEIIIDGYPILKYQNTNGDLFLFVRTTKLLCDHYEDYLPLMNKYFNDFDLAGHVNWHEGVNAPQQILTVHTNGDVITGTFPSTNPYLVRNMILSLEKEKNLAGLTEFQTKIEATHWSGILKNNHPSKLLEYGVPLIDIEIGSNHNCWTNSKAHEAIARALTTIFDPATNNVKSFLCIGGFHFTEIYSKAITISNEPLQIALSHILPNKWLIDGQYEKEEGIKKLKLCINSVIGGVNAIVFHDSIPKSIKLNLQKLLEELRIPIFRHKIFYHLNEIILKPD